MNEKVIDALTQPELPLAQTLHLPLSLALENLPGRYDTAVSNGHPRTAISNDSSG